MQRLCRNDVQRGTPSTLVISKSRKTLGLSFVVGGTMLAKTKFGIYRQCVYFHFPNQFQLYFFLLKGYIEFLNLAKFIVLICSL